MVYVKVHIFEHFKPRFHSIKHTTNFCSYSITHLQPIDRCEVVHGCPLGVDRSPCHHAQHLEEDHPILVVGVGLAGEVVRGLV